MASDILEKGCHPGLEQGNLFNFRFTSVSPSETQTVRGPRQALGTQAELLTQPR